MKLYAGDYFRNYVQDLEDRLLREIDSQEENYILNVNIDDYAAHIESKYKIDTPSLKFDDVSLDSVEKDIPSSRFPQYDFIGIGEKYYRKEVFIYHIPYTGNVNILQYRPNPLTLTSTEVPIDDRQQCLLIEIVNFYNDPNRIKQEYEQQLNYIKPNYNYLLANCDEYNNGLLSKIKMHVQNRKEKLLSKNNLMASLGVPIRNRENVAKTFSVPKPRLKEKIVISKPIVKDSKYVPEPTLNEDDYKKILKIINDVGKNLERMPSTYIGKGEEDIRDHILMVLDPNFELGSATGETFNKKGKTDICLRYDSSVVFIAECKYWKGEKAFSKTIDQLLGYLTWRNSKVAIINFVQNAEFTDVLNKIKASITTHPNYLRYINDSTESWFNYKFHLPGDRNREIDLAVISFHLPK